MKLFIVALFSTVGFFSLFTTYTVVHGRFEYETIRMDSSLREPTDTTASAEVGSVAVKNSIQYVKEYDGTWYPVNGERPLGFLYNKNIWPNTSDFINNGSTNSILSSKINFSGGANDFTQTLDVAPYTCLENWTASAKFKATQKNSTSYGFGFGIHSTEIAGNTPSFEVNFNAGTVAGVPGQLSINAGQGASLAPVAVSAAALSFTANDFITVTVQRKYNVIYARAYNNNTNTSVTANFAFTYGQAPYQVNTGHFAIYSKGGTFTLDSLGIYSSELINAQLCVFGDSKGSGSNTSGFNRRFPTLLNQDYRSTITLAGPGDQMNDMILRLPELAALRPKAVLLAGIGSNDIRGGASSAVINARFDSIVHFCSNFGAQVYILTPFPEHGGLNQAAMYDHIMTTYPASNVIDTYVALTNCDNCWSDSYHPNDKGDSVIYSTVINSGKILSTKAGASNDYIRDQNLIAQPGFIWLSNRIRTDDTLSGTGLVVDGIAYFNNRTLYITNEGYHGATTFHNTSYNYFVADLDIHVFRGGSADATHDPIIQLETTPGNLSVIGGELRFLNNNATVTNSPGYIYTTGNALASNSNGGDLWLMTNITGNIGGTLDFTTQYGNASILLKAAGNGAVKPYLTQFQSGVGYFRRAIGNVNATIAATDYLIAYSSLTATRTVTLATASAVTNQHFIIKDETGSASGAVKITIVGTIDGAVNPDAVATAYGVYKFYSNGSSYFKE